ncbi:MAG: hypothetical protein QGG53_04745 [Planctomycetota bacterium]|jgi:hypothetical protein|nr:hypothetical protein [Planctomycetota bacterium]
MKELIQHIDKERVERARQMTPAEKLLAGPRLFEEVCERMRAGIRYQFPEADEAEVEKILKERLATAKRLENSHDRR